MPAGTVTGNEFATVLARLERLEQIEAARGVFAAYATAVDNHDADALRRLYTARSVLDTRVGTFTGTDEIVEFFVRSWAAGPTGKRHFISNIAPTWVSPNVVSLEAYFLYVGRPLQDSGIGWGTYRCTVDTADPLTLIDHKIAVEVGTTLEAGWSAPIGR
ncbi:MULTISPECIES: nuclear transport factor 2 family protein [Rhodococcus]|uniref:nuclear transport factor 2 family protein n=1 Tax=Rhodococcus globerulus TaxID=33008 RepID=UPI001C56CB8B|nr:nuclear transport factor 2 family protein [Rhodococcus globerulus]QXV99949.1 nuclear transport factor 2 family protein [Rhodococcus globerulus]